MKTSKKITLVKQLILLAGFIFLFPTNSVLQQIDIPRIEQMPNKPAPYDMRDWEQVTVQYDNYVFDFNPNLPGPYLPLIWLNTNTINYPNHHSFGLHTVVGTTSPYSAEAINVLPAVISASLVGIDKSNQNGRNWVLMCEEWFNRRPAENVYLNHPVSTSGSDWWYDTMPNVYFYQLYSMYPTTGDFAYQFTMVADQWLKAVKKMGGSTTPWDVPYMNYRGWYLSTMTPNNTGVKEPEAAGALAWILYNAYQVTGNPAYRIGAEWCMEFLDNWTTNPSYELQLPYGAYIAARMNAELGTTYDIQKLVNWCFTTVGNVRNWGAIVGNWGGYDCSGLIGEVSSNDYAFMMNTFEQVGALVAMVRYDDRFARAMGKWVLNAANAARLLYPNYLPPGNQSNWNWASLNDTNSVIAYEAIHEYDPYNPGVSPYATGDAMSGGWGLTNLSLYGASRVGIFGTIIDTTNVEGILKLDGLKTDYFGDTAYPTYLYYNPDSVDHTVEIRVGSGQYDLYDAVSNSFLQTGVSGTVNFNIPADESILLVITPANGTISYNLNKMLINGVVADYRSGQPVANYPPRIKALAADSNFVLITDTTTLYCTAVDRDDDPLTFSWTTTGGSISGTGAAVSWIAPGTPGIFTIAAVVGDGNGGTDTAEVQLEAVESINHDPVISELNATPRKIDLGDTSQLACNASDPDGDTLSYHWSADGGTIAGSGAAAVWTAPLVEGNYYITCVVEDGRGGTDSSSIGIMVRDFSAFQTGSLVAHYPFDGNANDVSGNGHHGTVHGATLVEDRLGNPNSAYYFDGAGDYIIVPNHDSLNFREAMSINFWINIDTFLTREAFPISHGSWQNRWKVSVLPVPDKRLRWTINTTDGIKDLDTGIQPATDTWYNITVFYDGSDFEIYVDGQLDNFSSWSGLILTTTYDLTIGQMLPNNFQYNFKGTLDDIRIFNYGLLPQEIQDLYTGGVGISESQSSPVPQEFKLFQNYPNPFNPATTIEFAIPKSQHVTLKIYDVRGREVITLVKKRLTPGKYIFQWDATGIASGIYFYRLQAGRYHETKKLILLR